MGKWSTGMERVGRGSWLFQDSNVVAPACVN
jgi:hypothetical protein